MMPSIAFCLLLGAVGGLAACVLFLAAVVWIWR